MVTNIPVIRARDIVEHDGEDSRLVFLAHELVLPLNPNPVRPKATHERTAAVALMAVRQRIVRSPSLGGHLRHQALNLPLPRFELRLDELPLRYVDRHPVRELLGAGRIDHGGHDQRPLGDDEIASLQVARGDHPEALARHGPYAVRRRRVTWETDGVDSLKYALRVRINKSLAPAVERLCLRRRLLTRGYGHVDETMVGGGDYPILILLTHVLLEHKTV